VCSRWQWLFPLPVLRKEPTDTDPGIRYDERRLFARNIYLEHEPYQIELLTNLDQIPEAGAIVVVSFPKPKGGSGFPAWAFAIVP